MENPNNKYEPERCTVCGKKLSELESYICFECKNKVHKKIVEYEEVEWNKRNKNNAK